MVWNTLVLETRGTAEIFPCRANEVPDIDRATELNQGGAMQGHRLYSFSWGHAHSLPRCLESLRWDDGPNILGRGGRVYLDGDKGSPGCQYGVHVQQPSKRYYPCDLSWTFFNLESQGKLAVFFVNFFFMVNCRAFWRRPEPLSEPVLVAAMCQDR